MSNIGAIVGSSLGVHKSKEKHKKKDKKKQGLYFGIKPKNKRG